MDYSEQKKKFFKTEIMKKPWKWQKKVYESMVLRLDASIDKVEDLARVIYRKQNNAQAKGDQP